MKKIVLAALTVLSLGAGAASAQSLSHIGAHQAPYDNTQNSLGGRFAGGGGG
ncbi:MAG TPA: hypothetical protein VHU42_15640 [Rhodopila sp.]|jgi:hypothetical protein|nr:hypothetical protein [Rhodopila sp.]